MKWVLVLEGFPDKIRDPDVTELPTTRRTVVSYDGAEEAIRLMDRIVKGEIDPVTLEPYNKECGAV